MGLTVHNLTPLSGLTVQDSTPLAPPVALSRGGLYCSGLRGVRCILFSVIY
ncbi:hypothetical protein LCGC14_0392060 [marine sediment metagenome]|uniref:Uncharacterized protein n=1 Tax=marine sediment metagenome TaxID=412755 RepID=A0A0F9THB1_9ZZZZ